MGCVPAPPRPRTRRITALTIAAALTVSACASAPGTSSTPARLTHLTVGALPIVDDVPVYLAQQNGYFAQQGLSVTIKKVQQSTAALPDLLHGSVDIITGANYVSFFRAQAKGLISLRILADGADCVTGTHVILVLPHSGITTPAGLAGKTVAVNILNDVQTMLTGEVMEADDVHTMPRYVAIPFSAMPTALKAHRVQAIYAVEPYLSEAESKFGAQKILDTCAGDGNADLPLAGSVATDEWTRQHPAAARAFQRAMRQAAALADISRPAVEHAIVRDFGVPAKVAALVSLDRFPTSPDATQIQRMAQHMQASGLLAHPLNIAPLIFR